MIARREILLAGSGIVLLLAGSVLISRSHGAIQDTRIAGAAVRILQPTRLPQVGTAVVFHGLSANRIIMQYLAQWLAVQGFRAYLVDAPGHGATPGHFSNAETLDSSIRVLSELLRANQIDPRTTILVGHSMGGEIAIRLADYFPATATVALSPAPMILPRQVPSNLLVIGAQFDLPQMKDIAEELVRAAGRPRISAQDFLNHRAVQKIDVPWASHGSLVMNPTAVQATVLWARMARGLGGAPNDLPGAPIVGEILGILGLVLLFPAAASLVIGLFHVSSVQDRLPAVDMKKSGFATLLLYWGIAAMVGVGAIRFWTPQRLLPLYTGGYLAFFLLISGLLLLFFLKRTGGIGRAGFLAPGAAASVLAMVIIGGVGVWLHWQITDVWMHGSHLLYFFPLILMSLPYALAEEIALHRGGGVSNLKRWTLYLFLRLIVWLALLFGILVLFSGQVLLALLLPYLVVGSLGQRLGADWLRRHTGSPAASAIFSAILAAWFMAAVFPLA